MRWIDREGRWTVGFGGFSADAALPKQAFLNLILNALQAMTDGGTLTAWVRAHARDVEVSFSDTGPGIPSAIRSRLFEPFFSTKKDGTGLGLAVVKQIAVQHGATIRVHSDRGRTHRACPERSEGFAPTMKGATFSLVFPLQAASTGVSVRRERRRTSLGDDDERTTP